MHITLKLFVFILIAVVVFYIVLRTYRNDAYYDNELNEDDVIGDDYDDEDDDYDSDENETENDQTNVTITTLSIPRAIEPRYQIVPEPLVIGVDEHANHVVLRSEPVLALESANSHNGKSDQIDPVDLIDDRVCEILANTASDGLIRAKILAEMPGTDAIELARRLQALRANGVIHSTGAGRGTRWHANPASIETE